jgi:hypothetical protein
VDSHARAEFQEAVLQGAILEAYSYLLLRLLEQAVV